MTSEWDELWGHEMTFAGKVFGSSFSKRLFFNEAKYYVGSTHSGKKRKKEHNSGHQKAKTKHIFTFRNFFQISLVRASTIFLCVVCCEKRNCEVSHTGRYKYKKIDLFRSFNYHCSWHFFNPTWSSLPSSHFGFPAQSFSQLWDHS